MNSKLLDIFTYYLNLPIKNIFFQYISIALRKLTANDKNQEIFSIHCKPIPLMTTGFSLCSISNREKPVFINWEPCNEYRFFPLWKYYTGKTRQVFIRKFFLQIQCKCKTWIMLRTLFNYLFSCCSCTLYIMPKNYIIIKNSPPKVLL